MKISARDFSCCLAREIILQQRICVCLGQITTFRNFMNEGTQKKRQEAFLHKTFIKTRLLLFLKSKRVHFFLRGKLRASDFARCASYFEEHLVLRTVHVFQNFYENCKEYEESLNQKAITIQIYNQMCNLLYRRLVEPLHQEPGQTGVDRGQSLA